MSFQVGQKVLFGRDNGEKTLGEVVKINPKRVKVKQLEARGSFRSYPVGTIWTVAPSLMCPADGVSARVEAQPVVTSKPKRSEHEIMLNILGVHTAMSPENLHADGERSRSEAARLYRHLKGKLRELFVELGREVSETEAYEAVMKAKQVV